MRIRSYFHRSFMWIQSCFYWLMVLKLLLFVYLLMNGNYWVFNIEYLGLFVIKLCALYIMEHLELISELVKKQFLNVFEYSKEINYCKGKYI